MLILSYNLTPGLDLALKKIDKLRDRILLTPLNPKNEIILSWQAVLQHLSGWAHLSNQPLTPDAIEKILLLPNPAKSNSPFIQKVVGYRNALHHLRLEWIANPQTISPSHLKKLASILNVNYSHEDEIVSLLGYIQSGNVHPIIQSAIAHLYFYPSRLSYLTSLLILYKHNYDSKRLISLEDYWNSNKSDYLEVLQQATKLGHITLWLEYYCKAVIFQMESILKHMTQPTPPNHPGTKYWQLSDRQKDILLLLDPPNLTISNKKVQSQFQISQVTASRDLAKLASLNLLIPHGHGRSVIYTRA